MTDLVSEVESGLVVLVTAPNFIKGSKIGVTIKKCKDHESAWIIQLLDPNIITRNICVGANKGDSIKVG